MSKSFDGNVINNLKVVGPEVGHKDEPGLPER